jgi:hypothetical protein
MSETSAVNVPNLSNKPRRRWRRVIWVLGILTIVLAVVIGTAPSIVAHTGLRDFAINEILASPSVTASSDSASFGYFSPLSIHGLHLTSTNNHVVVDVQDIASEQAPYQLWSSAPDLGTIRVERPHVILELPPDVEIHPRHNRLEPTFTAILKDAGLTVRLAGQQEPIIDVDDLNMTARVEKGEEGRVLSLDPVVIFDRRKVSPKLAGKLLHLFDPTMSDNPDISGEFSFSLDKLRIPIELPKEEAVKRLEVEGKLVLNQVSTDVKNPMEQALVQLVADMNGKRSTEVLHLARNAEVHFQARDGRLHYEGLQVGLPDIDPSLQIASHGSVGLDRTLDLYVELPRLDEALRKVKGPAQCRITGTIDNPKINVKDGSFVLRQHGQKEPMFATDGIDLSMEVENTPKGRVLVLEPVEICKKKKLSLVVASGLLKLLAPDVVDTEREVDGEVSLSLTKLRMPLITDTEEAAKQLEAEGKLTLHQVASTVKSPMWQALLKVIADMNDKPPPKGSRLVVDAEIPFQARDGRLHHDGLRIGFPDIDPALVVSTHGSIGLDETLDLFADLPRLDKALRKEKTPARCHITGTIDNPKIAVKDGTIVLREQGHKEPVIAADGVDLNMRVENTAKGRVLVLEPVEIFKKTKLNLGVASGLLKLLAPDVADPERQVTGEISLSVTRLRMPLVPGAEDVVKQVDAEGKLTLHQVSAEVKSPMWQALIRVIADMHGKKPSNVMHLVEESVIHFQARDGRLYHDGQRLGFPEIDPELMVESHGSIGLDETVDLDLDLPRLRKDQLDKGPLHCRVTGTILQPKIAMQAGRLVVRLKDGDKAALTVDNVNLIFGVEDSKNGKMLTLAPVTVFEKQKLTPEMGDELLHLIVPTLSDLTGVQGEISLSLDTFRVPLGVPRSELEKKVELSGKLQLYQITASTKTPLLQTLVKMVADMYGKKASDVVRIVKNADVRFQVRDGRMYHEGLRIGFPDISQDLLISSHGSVGFDKSLDFELSVPGILVDKKELGIKKGDTVYFRVTGTIDKPVVTQVKKDGKNK